jgi:serine-type D-Ala-D-Ala carboxypeptidase (penicillin-binding protein 5/6)
MEVQMKKLLLLLLVLIIFSTSICVAYAEPPQIDAGACVLIDAKSGEILYEKNKDNKLYPASTTKIMTAILALEKGDLQQVMTASQEAVDDIGKDGSNIGIMPGEEISMEYLLQALLISSANETANIIAENICSTRQEFVDQMNQKAKELGAVNTHFVNPCGAHNTEHYTTAADLAKIASYAMTFPKFREIVHMNNFQMPPTNKHDSWPVLATTNKLMQNDKSEIYEINGVKTGYTSPAGYNLVSSAVNTQGMELISVIMDVQNEGAQNNVKKYSKELLDYGFNNFSQVTLQENNKVYRSVSVEDAEDLTQLDLITKGEIRYVLPNDTSSWNIKEIPHINSTISAPVNEGDIIGYIEYLKNDQSIGKVDVVASRSVKQKPQIVITNKVKSLLDDKYIKFSLIAVSIIFVLIILRAVLRKISRMVNSKKRDSF